MDYTPVTPFRRPVESALLARQASVRQAPRQTGIDKWHLLRELATARTAFGLSDRTLSVLQALLSFHRSAALDPADGLVVFPSNSTLCARLNGMPCSTMRRHLAALVAAGMVLRRDSPNGKRYARRCGDSTVAFGFDLSPLLHRADEIAAAARDARQSAERLRSLRCDVSLMRRDLAALVAYGQSRRPGDPVWDEADDLATLTARDLRRRLTAEDLDALKARLGTVLADLGDRLEPSELGTNDTQNEQHFQESEEESFEQDQLADPATGSGPDPRSTAKIGRVPLGLVLSTCKEIQPYLDRPIRHWHDLVRVADTLSPMLGVSASAWDDAQRHMGPEEAAIVVAAMLERARDIRSPGGYLRALTAKAQRGDFTAAPMVLSLARRAAA